MRRVVVDTNVWVSALLNPAGPPAQVPQALQDRGFSLVVSEPLLAELAEVLRRPRFAQKYGVTEADIRELMALLRARAHVVPVTGGIRLCRDPDDDVVVETALRGRADTVVTRDDDLKGDAELVRVLAAQGIEVLAVRRFLALLEEEEQQAERGFPESR